MNPVINEFNGEEIAMKGKKVASINGDSNTALPVDVQFDADLHTVFNEGLPEALPEKSKEGYGLFRNTGASFNEQEELVQTAELSSRKLADTSPLDDYVDPNWNAAEDKSVYIGVDPRNMGYILDATGPKDQRRRYNYVLDQQEHSERISNGSLIGQLLGGAGGFIFSPSSLFPIAKSLKYAKVSQAFLQNLPKMAAGIATSSAAHEAVLETSKTGGNLHDWAVSTAVDTVMGTVFMGAHLGFNYATEASKLYQARGVLKLANDGIDIRPEVDEKGVLKRWTIHNYGDASAAKVDMAQVYLDSALSKSSIHSIPYIGDMVGTALGKSGSWLAGAISPKIRMLNSGNETLRGLVNNYVEHSFETVGMQEGRPVETPFETMMSMIRGTNTNMKVQYDGLYMKRNGIEFDPEKSGAQTYAGIKDIATKYFKDGQISRDDFGREVQYALITEEPSNISAVNEAASLLREQMDPLYLESLKLHGISDKILKPRTANGYLSRVYWTARMELKEEEWVNGLAEELGRYDEEINSVMVPINNLQERIKNADLAHAELIRTSGIDNASVKKSSDRIEAMRLRLTEMQNETQNMLRDNPDMDIHIEDRNAVSANEAQQINAILKPLKDAEKNVVEQQTIVSQLKKTKGKKKQAAHKGKTAETAKKHAELQDQIAAQLEQEEAKLADLQKKHLDEQQKIYEKMYNKEIPQELYFKNNKTEKYELKDSSNRLKMREVFSSLGDREASAKAYYDSILNQTAEDNIDNIMNKAMGSDKENPVVERTLLVRDKWLYDNKWLHPDPSINVMNYRNFLGRKNAIKKVLNRLTVNGTFEELIERFELEHTLQKQGIADKYKPDTKKYEDEILAAGKSHKKNREDFELTVAQMQGKSKYSAKGRQYSRMANLYAVATKLGFLPATMSTDTMANVFKQGFWPSIKDGLFPMLKNLGGMLNTKEGQAIRENAAHAYVASRHVNMAYSDKNWTGTSQTYEPVQGKLTKGLETLAHYSGNFTGANYVENFNERMTAFIINSKIMRAMKNFTEGKISEKDHKDLLRYGLDPHVLAERFLKGRSEKNFSGAGIGYYWQWADKEASNMMSQAIHRGVKDTIIRRGLLDAPFAMDNPIFSSIFLFKGYVLASMTRFLGPLMQKPDAQKLIGTMLMMAAGATQNPLRRLVAGQDPMQEEDHMFRNAVRDGGVFSVLGDVYEEINFLSNGLLQETVTNERYRGRTEMGVFNGPVGSMANDMTRIIGAVAHNEMNQTDLKRLAVNTPFVYSWQLRYLTNQWIENTGLPKTRAMAHKRANQ